MTAFVNQLSGARGSYDVVSVLSQVLTQLIDINANSSRPSAPSPSVAPSLAKFQSSYAPTISIHSYLSRIQKYANLTPAVYTTTLIYIDRLIEATNLSLTPLNIHRLLLVAVVVATKFLQDDYYKNCYYAKLGGITTAELNSLEICFLSLISFNLYVSPAAFDKYTSELMAYTPGSPPTPSPTPSPCAIVKPVAPFYYRSPSPNTVAPSISPPYFPPCYYYATSNPPPPYFYPQYFPPQPPAPYYYYNSSYPLVVASSM